MFSQIYSAFFKNVNLTNFYKFSVNKNQAGLRDRFVAHAGQKKLVVTMPSNRDTADFGDLAGQMSEKIQENVRNSRSSVEISALILLLSIGRRSRSQRMDDAQFYHDHSGRCRDMFYHDDGVNEVVSPARSASNRRPAVTVLTQHPYM